MRSGHGQSQPQKKGLQRLLGFSNFYCHFIRNFSSVAAPLTSLLKVGPRILVWSPAADEAICLLKGRFTSAPLLRLSRPDLSSFFMSLFWFGQGVSWGGHSLFCTSMCLAWYGSQSEVAVNQPFLGSLFPPVFVGSCFLSLHQTELFRVGLVLLFCLSVLS
jgi:hypothetical protein